jgi:hypothetical protein
MRLYNTAPGGQSGMRTWRLVIQDYLTMPIWGCLFPSASLDTTTLLSTVDAGTTGDAAAQTYCTAMGFGMSPVLSSQEKALIILVKRWCDIFNIAPVFNGFELKFIPYSLDPVTANGVTFVPNTASAYTLTDKPISSEQRPDSEGVDPVIVTRCRPGQGQEPAEDGD